MANEQNLIPITDRSEEDAQEIRSAGGRKSSQVRRRKKSMKQVMDMLLQMPAGMQTDYQMLADMGLDLNGLDTDEINNMLVVNAALLRGAKLGDVASIKELRSIIEDDAALKHKIKTDKAYLELEKQKIMPPVREDAPYAGIPATMIAPTFTPVLSRRIRTTIRTMKRKILISLDKP